MSKRIYGTKFPLSNNSQELTFFDLNHSKEEAIRSQLIHLLLTIKGQRLRNPEFGVNLMSYIFNMNDSLSWQDIKNDITEQVAKYIPEVTFNDINILKDEENEHNVFLELDYLIESDGEIKENKTVIKI